MEAKAHGDGMEVRVVEVREVGMEVRVGEVREVGMEMRVGGGGWRGEIGGEYW